MAEDTSEGTTPSTPVLLKDLIRPNYLEEERAELEPDPLAVVEPHAALTGVLGQLDERFNRAPRLRKMPYDEYLRSPEWREMRRMVIQAARYRCERCFAEVPLQVHHKTYANRGCEEFEDLEAICRDCHEKEHGIVH